MGTAGLEPATPPAKPGFPTELRARSGGDSTRRSWTNASGRASCRSLEPQPTAGNGPSRLPLGLEAVEAEGARRRASRALARGGASARRGVAVPGHAAGDPGRHLRDVEGPGPRLAAPAFSPRCSVTTPPRVTPAPSLQVATRRTVPNAGGGCCRLRVVWRCAPSPGRCAGGACMLRGRWRRRWRRRRGAAGWIWRSRTPRRWIPWSGTASRRIRRGWRNAPSQGSVRFTTAWPVSRVEPVQRSGVPIRGPDQAAGEDRWPR